MYIIVVPWSGYWVLVWLTSSGDRLSSHSQIEPVFFSVHGEHSHGFCLVNTHMHGLLGEHSHGLLDNHSHGFLGEFEK